MGPHYHIERHGRIALANFGRQYCLPYFAKKLTEILPNHGICHNLAPIQMVTKSHEHHENLMWMDFGSQPNNPLIPKFDACSVFLGEIQ
jgi:hypothetical protein